MRQELVFIGQSLDEKAITNALDNCLVTEDDMLKGVELFLSITNFWSLKVSSINDYQLIKFQYLHQPTIKINMARLIQ